MNAPTKWAIGCGGIIFAPIALLALPVVITYLELLGRYDKSNPDYPYVMSVARAATPTRLDLSRLNGGDWQLLCIFGSYTHPERAVRVEAAKRGIALASFERVSTRVFAPFPVEEDEGAISFVDQKGNGRTLLIRGFIRPLCSGKQQCFTRETTDVLLSPHCD